MAEPKFPKNAGKVIPNGTAAAECEAYQKKYPDRPAGFSKNKGELMKGINQAVRNGASAIGILNCLKADDKTYYIGVGFVTEEGKWVDKDEQTVDDFKNFKATHKEETAGYFWGVDFAKTFIRSDGGEIKFSNAIGPDGKNTLCAPPDVDGGKDEGGTPNFPVICPTTCPNDD